MTERPFDASLDLHDSYYAAVAELRQRHETSGLPAPMLNIKVEQAKADAIITLAIKLKDWPLVENAIDKKIDQQGEFVSEWNKRVTARQGLNQYTEVISDTDMTISAARLSQLSGISPMQVSRWGKKLKDIEKYRAQLLLAAYRKAGLEPLANHRAEGTGEYEWYTPARFIEAAREVMGGIDLDPASHPAAQETVRAAAFFTEANDGLRQQWHGRVWLNPPYVHPTMSQFVEKLVNEVSARRVEQAIMLTHNYTDTGWFHCGEAAADLLCFTRGRIAFLDADGDITGPPTQGQAFFYYGPNADRFRDVFSRFGFIR